MTTDVDVSATNDAILEFQPDPQPGAYVGITKWFGPYGWGFITSMSPGPLYGKDIFVHHTGIRPLNSQYRTLRKGEYVEMNVVEGDQGLQAVDVTGIKGGPLSCDFVDTKRSSNAARPPPQQQTARTQQQQQAPAYAYAKTSYRVPSRRLSIHDDVEANGRDQS
jgi:cold shock CspA family protein